MANRGLIRFSILAAMMAYLLDIKRRHDPDGFWVLVDQFASFLIMLASLFFCSFFCSSSLQQKLKDYLVTSLGGQTEQVRLLGLENKKTFETEVNTMVQNAQAKEKELIEKLAIANNTIQVTNNSVDALKERVEELMKEKEVADAKCDSVKRIWKVDQAQMERQNSYFHKQLIDTARERNQCDDTLRDLRKEHDQVVKMLSKREEELKGLKENMKKQETEFKEKIENNRATYQAAIDTHHAETYGLKENYPCLQNTIALQYVHIENQNTVAAEQNKYIKFLEEQLEASRLREKPRGDTKKEKKLKKDVKELKIWVNSVENDKADLLIEKAKLEKEKETATKDAAVQLAYLHKEHMKKEKASSARLQKLRKESDQSKKDLVSETEERKAYIKWCEVNHIGKPVEALWAESFLITGSPSSKKAEEHNKAVEVDVEVEESKPAEAMVVEEFSSADPSSDVVVEGGPVDMDVDTEPIPHFDTNVTSEEPHVDVDMDVDHDTFQIIDVDDTSSDWLYDSD